MTARFEVQLVHESGHIISTVTIEAPEDMRPRWLYVLAPDKEPLATLRIGRKGEQK